MMLQHLGERAAADRVDRAIAVVIAEGKKVTYDLKRTPDDPILVDLERFRRGHWTANSVQINAFRDGTGRILGKSVIL